MPGQEDSDDDFRPALTLRKRKSMPYYNKISKCNKPNISQRKRSSGPAPDKEAQGKKMAIDAPFLPGISPVTTRDELAIIGKKVVVIKTTINNIWKPAYIQPLHELVNITKWSCIHLPLSNISL